MSGLHPCKLGDVVKFGNGKARTNSEGEIPVYGGNGILGYSADSNYNEETIIIGRVGAYCGATYYEHRPIWVSDNALSAKPKNNNNTKFLFYFLKHMNLNQHAQGSSHPLLTQGLLNSIDIEIVADPEEQRSIASVLSSLDDKIDLLHRQNKTLEAMAETLFQHWFVEDVQEDWEKGKLGDVIEIFDGQRIPLSKMERDKKKNGTLYPYYGAAKVMDYINDYIFDGEYILLGEDGTVRTDEGYPVLQYATGKFWVNNHTHVLKAKQPYSNFFLWNYLCKRNIDEIVTGAVQPKINQGNLKSLPFPAYPESLVKDYVAVSEPMLAKIKKNKEHIAQLEKLRDTFLPKLMSGEVMVAY